MNLIILNISGEILKVFTSMPLYAKILSIVTFLPLYYFKDAFGSLIKKIPVTEFNIFKKKVIIKEVVKYKESVYDFDQLLYHDFFLALKKVPLDINKIDFSDKKPLNKTKRKMMIILIDLKMKSINLNFTNLIKNKDLKGITAQEFKFLVMNTIQELIEEYNKDAVVEYLNLGISKSDAWLFVDSYEGYRATIIDSFIERLESICISESYKNNYDRLNAMLEILTVAVEVIPRDVKSLYLIINGKFDKYKDI